MSDYEEQTRGFKVTDRRAFTAEGDPRESNGLRDEVEEPLGQAEEAPTTTAPDDRSVSDQSATDPTSEATPANRRRRGRRGGRARNRSTNGDDNGATADLAPDETDAEVANDPIEDSPEDSPSEPHVDLAVAPEAFRALGLSDRSLAAVMEMGFTEPTPVQARSIPVLLEGFDVVGIAQTGTGKTLAFGLPMAEQLDPSRAEAQALVLVPTRELAQQVLAVLTDIGRPFGLRTVGLLGGHARTSSSARRGASRTTCGGARSR